MHYENANEGEVVQTGLYQLLIQHNRRRLHGGDRSQAKKLWGRLGGIAPLEFC